MHKKISHYLFICCFLFICSNSFAQITIDFSHKRGFYTKIFNLNVNVIGDNVKVLFTIDGSEPTQTHGFSVDNTNSFSISKINRSTVVRVFAYNNDISATATQTYLFTKDVFSQNNNRVINELLFPNLWGYGTSFSDAISCRIQAANYEMTIDECFTNEIDYEQKLYDGLMQIPTMAISLDKQQIFGADSGLYVYPVDKSDDCYTLPENVDSWERKASVEIFNDVQGDEKLSAQVNAGLSISGYSSRYLDFYKHSFQLKFKEKYGASKFEYPLYGKKGINSFKNLELRMIAHSSPHDWAESRREESQYHKDNWVRNLQKQLSGDASSANSKFFHLFINGLYWGIYDVCERPDANYMAAYYGGAPDNYDVINHTGIDNGSDDDYKYMYDVGHSIYDTILTNPVTNQATGEVFYNTNIIANEERANSFYKEIQNYLDVENFIDYSLLNLYLVNADWSDNNWWAARDRENGKFQFFAWDSEIVLNMAGISNQVLIYAGNSNNRYKYNPIDLNQRLLDVPEYKIKYADHIQCNCVEQDGVLNPKNLAASYKAAEEKIHNATMLEFARWGNARKEDIRYEPICFDVIEKTVQDYEAEVFPNLLTNTLLYYSNPTGAYNLFPNYISKVNRNGESVIEEIYNFKAVQYSKFGGTVEEGYQLTLTNPNEVGNIYYTIDGTDPRNVDGTIANKAIKYTGPLTIKKTSEVKARVFAETFSYKDRGTKTINNLWTAMCPRKFYMPEEAPQEEQEETPVSIDAYANSAIKVFPKPVKNQLNITGLPAQVNNVIKVFTINGQVLIEENITATTSILNTYSLHNGHYMVTVSKNNEVIFVDKIIKMD